ncbi:hypothetical protein EDB80DRAFT_722960 [Ilyonectria destructans]|nr:hypothetical protein EDB80DRAFT_722960 [Ilyonectria destructans]
MILPRSALTILIAVLATSGVNATPCRATTTSAPAQETPETTSAPSTTSTTTTEIPTVTVTKRFFLPKNARRDGGDGFGEPDWSLSDGATIEEDTEIAHSGDHYVLVRIEDDEKMPSIEENITEEIETAEPGVLSYSWALADHQDLGKDGVCSIVSKLDGIVVDTLKFSSSPANKYQDHEAIVSFHSPKPVFSMDFSCSGGDFSRVGVLIDDVSLTAVPLNQDLRR